MYSSYQIDIVLANDKSIEHHPMDPTREHGKEGVAQDGAIRGTIVLYPRLSCRVFDLI